MCQAIRILTINHLRWFSFLLIHPEHIDALRTFTAKQQCMKCQAKKQFSSGLTLWIAIRESSLELDENSFEIRMKIWSKVVKQKCWRENSTLPFLVVLKHFIENRSQSLILRNTSQIQTISQNNDITYFHTYKHMTRLEFRLVNLDNINNRNSPLGVEFRFHIFSNLVNVF